MDQLLSWARKQHGPGIGVDVEDVRRWRTPPRTNAFSVAEWEHCHRYADPAPSLAGRWCAKEAVVKAMSTWLVLGPRDIEVQAAPGGMPIVKLGPRVADQWAGSIQVSIAHSDSVAVAVAVAVPANLCGNG